jgi:hypothetical protein
MRLKAILAIRESVMIMIPLFDVQSDLLGIIGQEAVAHAGLIFASLTTTLYANGNA